MKITRILWLACITLSLNSLALAGSLLITNADFSAVPIVCQGYSYQSFGGACGSDPPQQDFNGTPGSAQGNRSS